ncbi:hypothetical protein KF2_010 [Vibrio phage vB_VpaP_KF2]|uniref:Uncharacterized protein n=3 Tax=Maculvirus TaxID=2731958 RepID=A0A7T7K8U5_9CAUD|nr:hypothetical protein HOT90_gp10 [Vibrio phage vB_VpaP_KF2]ATI19078.1 hypothetical protein KF2_010 [Vibrio phage vB_VpaP_KF2]QQM14891.1 hypothetical protein vBVcSrVc2_00001 [Vibrio phage vB_Vc_SrVc2]CAB3563572.1 hypothetical protein EHFPEHOM_00001 [Vibrio phage vB_Vc_SrVc9]
MFKRLKQLSKSFYLTFIRPRRVYHFEVVYRDGLRRIQKKHFQVCARTRNEAYGLARHVSYINNVRGYKLSLTNVSLFDGGQSMQSAY